MIETRDIAVGDFRFTTDLAGPEDGPAVVLLHGFPNSRHSWKELQQPLAQAGFRTIAPDQRGYSPGARPDGIEAYGVDSIIADVLALSETVGAERFHLVGHDWGGQIAWLTAARHAERLRSLTVLSRPHPAAFAKAFRDDPAQAGRSRHHKAFQEPDMATRLLDDGAASIRNTLCYERAYGLFGKDGAGTAAPKRRMSDALAEAHLSVLGSEAAMDAALNWYRAAFARGTIHPADADLAITVPTLYIWGDEDMSVGEMAAAGTPDQVTAACRFETIEGAGHFLAEEVPDRIATLLLAHLDANASA